MTDRMRVEIERLDAHPGDLHGLDLQVEVPGELLLSEWLRTVLQPFLAKAPRAAWLCRGRSGGRWRDLAEVVTFGASEMLGARLLVDDQPLHVFVGSADTVLHVACRPR